MSEPLSAHAAALTKALLGLPYGKPASQAEVQELALACLRFGAALLGLVDGSASLRGVVDTALRSLPLGDQEAWRRVLGELRGNKSEVLGRPCGRIREVFEKAAVAVEHARGGGASADLEEAARRSGSGQVETALSGQRLALVRMLRRPEPVLEEDIIQALWPQELLSPEVRMREQLRGSDLPDDQKQILLQIARSEDWQPTPREQLRSRLRQLSRKTNDACRRHDLGGKIVRPRGCRPP